MFQISPTPGSRLLPVTRTEMAFGPSPKNYLHHLQYVLIVNDLFVLVLENHFQTNCVLEVFVYFYSYCHLQQSKLLKSVKTNKAIVESTLKQSCFPPCWLYHTSGGWEITWRLMMVGKERSRNRPAGSLIFLMRGGGAGRGGYIFF